MQVYEGLDVLTNKVTLQDRSGVLHHLLGIIDASVDFTSRDFRDLAIPALVSLFLTDDLVEDTNEFSLRFSEGNLQQKLKPDPGNNNSSFAFDCLKEIDQAAANRIHSNDHGKINR